jgi:hypothetical protein
MIKIDRKYYSLNNLLLPFDKNKSSAEKLFYYHRKRLTNPQLIILIKSFFIFVNSF